jgi:hypothetical protein
MLIGDVCCIQDGEPDGAGRLPGLLGGGGPHAERGHRGAGPQHHQHLLFCQISPPEDVSQVGKCHLLTGELGYILSNGVDRGIYY